MVLAIFIFLISILVLASNIHIYVKSMNDTLKVYVKIAMFYVLIPHHKIFSKLFTNKNVNLNTIKKDLISGKRLTLNIFSHSVINHIYIAKFSNSYLYNEPISNGLYLIVANQIRGLLQSRFKIVNVDDIRLNYEKRYENIDYYVDAYISMIDLIWALVKTVLKR